MSETEATDQPGAAGQEESIQEEAHQEPASEDLKLLRRKRGQKLAAFSRVCHRAEAIIAARGSRSRLEGLLETIDSSLEGFIAANEALEDCLTSQTDRTDAEAYCAKAERDR